MRLLRFDTIATNWNDRCMIDFDLMNSITEYAQKHTESSSELYKSRNHQSDKIFHDILNGKIAEYNLYFELIELGYILDPPDIEIYQYGTKSYDADLVIIGKNDIIYEVPNYVHVKSMSLRSVELFGHSVTFQKNDPVVKNPENNHYIVLMKQVDHSTYTTFKWLPTVEAKYEPTRKNLPSKCALYFK